jgi:hypothetical protein
VSVQYQLVLLRQRDHASGHGQVGVGAVDMELAMATSRCGRAVPRGTQ